MQDIESIIAALATGESLWNAITKERAWISEFDRSKMVIAKEMPLSEWLREIDPYWWGQKEFPKEGLTISEKPTTLVPMTRNEVLGFVTHNPHIVVRRKSNEWMLATPHMYHEEILHEYEWAAISSDGVVGEPHKFVKEVVQ